MRLVDLLDARVALLGLGREGRATRDALARAGHRGAITVIEDAPRPAGETLPWHSGEAALAALAHVDVVVASPGVPPRHAVHVAAAGRGLPVTTGTNLFLAECAHEDIPVIAVTGSKGKSTTSTLLALSLREAGLGAALVGNVGTPALEAVESVVAGRPAVVFEMSSYQARFLDRGPETSVIVELFPEHLDWHGSAERYFADKLRVAALQDAAGLTIWNGANAELARRAPLGPARHEAFNVAGGVRFEDGWFLRGDERLFQDTDMRLRGAHNRRNACGVIAAAASLGVPPDAVARVLATFAGLPHRLEPVRERAGVQWINDSISTAPTAAVAALESFAGRSRTLIAGGHDRGQDFSPLIAALLAGGADRIAAIPPAGERLRVELAAAGARATPFAGPVVEAPDLPAAVAWAARETPPGGVVLLSPAAPSFGEFRDFEHRGDRFREIVKALD